MSCGLSVREVAVQVGETTRFVTKRLEELRRELQVYSRRELVAYLLEAAKNA
jgi:DNA-binding NarL/FixJ family response regulator